MRFTAFLVLILGSACMVGPGGLGDVDGVGGAGGAPEGGQDAALPDLAVAPDQARSPDQAPADTTPLPDPAPDLAPPYDPSRESWTANLPGFPGPCDPRTGQFLKGDGACSCQWKCSTVDAPQYAGSGISYCAVPAATAQEGMPCGGAVTKYEPPSGVPPYNTPEVRTTKALACASGSMCLPAPPGRVWRAENPVSGTWTVGQGVCRRYCIAGDGACAGRACQPVLPCDKIGGVFGQAPQPIPGVGLCEPGPPNGSGYQKSGWWDPDGLAWSP